MQAKKTSKANLENKRFGFFLLGLGIALLSCIAILELNFAIEVPEVKVTKGEIVDIDYPPVTLPPEPKKPQDQPQKAPQVEPADPDRFIEGDPAPEPTPAPEPQVQSDPPPLVDIQPEPEIDNTPVSIAVLEKIAVPPACAHLNDKQERMNCLNDWIQTYIAKHVNYPEILRAMGIQERLYVTITVDHKGQIIEVVPIKPSNPAFGEEAIRVLSSMPSFENATQRGRPVGMRFTIPVNFVLR